MEAAVSRRMAMILIVQDSRQDDFSGQTLAMIVIAQDKTISPVLGPMFVDFQVWFGSS
jgi:hypothetical protein